jgi:hypothetical protein
MLSVSLKRLNKSRLAVIQLFSLNPLLTGVSACDIPVGQISLGSTLVCNRQKTVLLLHHQSN